MKQDKGNRSVDSRKQIRKPKTAQERQPTAKRQLQGLARSPTPQWQVQTRRVWRQAKRQAEINPKQPNNAKKCKRPKLNNQRSNRDTNGCDSSSNAQYQLMERKTSETGLREKFRRPKPLWQEEKDQGRMRRRTTVPNSNQNGPNDTRTVV